MLAACEALPKDQAHFAKGFEAYKKGDFYTALLYLKPLVEEGNPAAELLMAKMYANGEGVAEDVGKAELLRNLAATKLYARPYAPGTIQSANGTLKSVQDRLDYYTDGANSGKGLPVQDVSQLLTSLDLNSIKRLAATDFENPGSDQNPPPETASEASPSSPETSPAQVEVEAPHENRPTPPPSVPVVSPEAIDLSHARNANHISLTLLQQSAHQNDALAMQLLATAYEKGYYGLTPDPSQATVWKEKARNARHFQSPSSENNDPEDAVPMARLAWVAMAGIVFIGGGIWARVKRGRRRLS
jgi:TPR repeat protein